MRKLITLLVLSFFYCPLVFGAIWTIYPDVDSARIKVIQDNAAFNDTINLNYHDNADSASCYNYLKQEDFFQLKKLVFVATKNYYFSEVRIFIRKISGSFLLFSSFFLFFLWYEMLKKDLTVKKDYGLPLFVIYVTIHLCAMVYKTFKPDDYTTIHILSCLQNGFILASLIYFDELKNLSVFKKLASEKGFSWATIMLSISIFVAIVVILLTGLSEESQYKKFKLDEWAKWFDVGYSAISMILVSAAIAYSFYKRKYGYYICSLIVIFGFFISFVQILLAYEVSSIIGLTDFYALAIASILIFTLLLILQAKSWVTELAIKSENKTNNKNLKSTLISEKKLLSQYKELSEEIIKKDIQIENLETQLKEIRINRESINQVEFKAKDLKNSVKENYPPKHSDMLTPINGMAIKFIKEDNRYGFLLTLEEKNISDFKVLLNNPYSSTIAYKELLSYCLAKILNLKTLFKVEENSVLNTERFIHNKNHPNISKGNQIIFSELINKAEGINNHLEKTNLIEGNQSTGFAIKIPDGAICFGDEILEDVYNLESELWVTGGKKWTNSFSFSHFEKLKNILKK